MEERRAGEGWARRGMHPCRSTSWAQRPPCSAAPSLSRMLACPCGRRRLQRHPAANPETAGVAWPSLAPNLRGSPRPRRNTASSHPRILPTPPCCSENRCAAGGCRQQEQRQAGLLGGWPRWAGPQPHAASGAGQGRACRAQHGAFAPDSGRQPMHRRPELPPSRPWLCRGAHQMLLRMGARYMRACEGYSAPPGLRKRSRATSTLSSIDSRSRK